MMGWEKFYLVPVDRKKEGNNDDEEVIQNN